MYNWSKKVKCCVIGTDGLWDMVSSQETLEILKPNKDTQFIVNFYNFIIFF